MLIAHAFLFVCARLICTLAITYISFICIHNNGKFIHYLVKSIAQPITRSNATMSSDSLLFVEDISVESSLLIGLMPLAIISLLPVALQSCFNSLTAFLGFEGILFSCLILVYPSLRSRCDFFGLQIMWKNRGMIICVSLWCLFFSLWVFVNCSISLEPLLANTNPDIWAYIRRFSAMITENLFFYGGNDSFIFEGNSGHWPVKE